MSIGKNISKARRKLGMSQSELARVIGVSPQSVQLWESEKNEPRRHRAIKIAKALGMSTMELEYGEGETSYTLTPPSAAPLSHSDLVNTTLNKLSEREQLILSCFRKLNNELQEHLILIAESRIEADNASIDEFSLNCSKKNKALKKYG